MASFHNTLESTGRTSGTSEQYANDGELNSDGEIFKLLSKLNKVLSIHQEATRITSDPNPKLALRSKRAGEALRAQFQQNKDSTILERAVSHYDRAPITTDDGDLTKLFSLWDLGTMLHLRFEHLGDPADIDKAILNYQEAVKMLPDSYPDKQNLLSNLGVSLTSRFERLGNLTDLNDAIEVHKKAVKTTPYSHPGKPSRLTSLGNSLSRRFEWLGSLNDLESAIAVHKLAVKITPDGHPDKPFRLSNLGVVLTSRFEWLGNLTDLNDAIEVHKKAVETTPDGHPEKQNLFSNLGVSFTSRFERLDNLTDLDNAISAHQEAVYITPDGHPAQPWRLNRLGASLTSLFQRLGGLTDLERAIAVHQNAVEITPDNHPDKPFWLSSLGISLVSRFDRLGNLIDLDSGIAVHHKALMVTPNGHPSKLSRLNHLGNSLSRRFERLGDRNDLEYALQIFSQSAHSLFGPPSVRFYAACQWANALNQHLRSPLPAFQYAIDLLPRIAWFGLSDIDRRALVTEVGGIVRGAVAAAVELGEYEAAVEWTEQGRSIVWKNLLGFRSPVDELRKFSPALASRLQNIGHQLEFPVPRDMKSDKTFATPSENIAQRYSKLSTEWELMVRQIRQIPEFEGFLRAKSFSKLAPAACEGPIIILNVHQSRSDALVLIPDYSNSLSTSAVNIPLKPFVYQLSKILFAGMNRSLSSSGHRGSQRVKNSEDGELNFSEILGLLWLAVVKPVLDGLAFSAESNGQPRVWWCATGPLSFLPIHAAGIYGAEEKGNIVSDYIVSSYIPTLSSILEQSQPMLQANFQMLAVSVAQPSILSVNPIPGTEEEVQRIQIVAKAEGIRCVNLTREKATVKCVLEEMMESNWVHLACYGHNNKNSRKSGFLLHDRILSFSQIAKLSLPKTEFAFLSACQAVQADEAFAEESIYRAAVMLLLGCRGVINTMWSINDNDAPEVAEHVYREMLKNGRPNRKGAAYALHKAAKRLRESGAHFPSWVPYIHVGR